MQRNADQDDADRGWRALSRRGRRRIVVRVEGRLQGRSRLPQRTLIYVVQPVISIADRLARVVLRSSIANLLGVFRQFHVCNARRMETRR